MAHVRVLRKPKPDGSENGRYVRACKKLTRSPDLLEAFKFMIHALDYAPDEEDPAQHVLRAL